MKKFLDEIVLGKGYPWAQGLKGKYKAISLSKDAQDINFENLKFPEKLWSSEVPEYELILRKVKK